MKLQQLNGDFSVCKVSDYSMADLDAEFCFVGKTDAERSLVCTTDRVPPNATACDDGWRGLRVQGPLDFGLIGILAQIASVLAEHGIPIFAVSTYDTDYIFVKAGNYKKATEALGRAGYEIEA